VPACVDNVPSRDPASVDRYDRELSFSCLSFLVSLLVLQESRSHKKSYNKQVQQRQSVMQQEQVMFKYLIVSHTEFDSMR
jgi:hypothetical protein